VKTALIVDDSPSLRQLVAHTLTQAGFEVIQCGDGAEALRNLEGRSVQIIISDINMPVMDGITLVKQLRAKPAFRFTPILLLTTESQESRKQEGKAAGATGWLVKPFNPQQMLQVIAKVLP
jgi:two-component system, chemotaxis family, chemotaxis protein CheY